MTFANALVPGTTTATVPATGTVPATSTVPVPADCTDSFWTSSGVPQRPVRDVDWLKYVAAQQWRCSQQRAAAGTVAVAVQQVQAQSRSAAAVTGTGSPRVHVPSLHNCQRRGRDSLRASRVARFASTVVLTAMFHCVEHCNSGRTTGLLESLDGPGSNRLIQLFIEE